MSDGTKYERDGRLTGQCLCGAVTIRIDGRHRAAVGICHCRMCRVWSGMAFGNFEADEEAVTITGDVTRYASSDFAARYFCPTCGANLWFRNDAPGARYEFMPGAFPEAADFPLISEIYVEQAPAYLRISGDHRRRTAAEYEAEEPFVEGNQP